MNSVTSVLTRGVLNKCIKCLFAPNVVRLRCLQYCSIGNNSKKLQKVGNHGSQSMPNTQTYIQKLSQYVYFPRGSKIQKFKQFLYRKFLVRKSEHIDAGLHCYNTLTKINYVEFFALLNMPDTFYSWFKVTELHVWMLLMRLTDLKTEGLIIRKYLIEGMWDDTETRAKAMEPLNKEFKKNMSTLNDKFRIALFSYDEGYMKNDIALANAVWYQFFDKNCDDPRLVETLVSYIRFQVKFLDSLGLSVLTKEYNEKQVWTPLKPHLKVTN